jgi:two-component system, OmpR family, KDP operon response regulator KdpE
MRDQPLHVLIVDDEPQIRRVLRTSLNAHGYRVIEAADGQEALTRATTERPDIVLLDLGLPDVDGLDLIPRLRDGSAVPIIVISVRGREWDMIAALHSGADDYVTKPFEMGELLARVRAALSHRPPGAVEAPVLRSAGLTVDLVRRIVVVDGQVVELTSKECEMLRFLVIHAGKVVTHQQLLREVWDPASACDTPHLRAYMTHLRQKIEPDPTQPQYLLTEPGVGYRLCLREDP